MTVAAHHARQCTCARARGQQNVRPCSNHANRTDSRYTANKRNGNICVITSRATRKCTVMHRAAHRARAHFQPGEHRSLGVRLVRIHARSIHPRSFAMRATTFYLQLEAILRTNHSMMMHCAACDDVFAKCSFAGTGRYQLSAYMFTLSPSVCCACVRTRATFLYLGPVHGPVRRTTIVCNGETADCMSRRVARTSCREDAQNQIDNFHAYHPTRVSRGVMWCVVWCGCAARAAMAAASTAAIQLIIAIARTLVINAEMPFCLRGLARSACARALEIS